MAVIAALAESVRTSLLDLHFDKVHNRSVFTLAGDQLQQDLQNLSQLCANTLDIRLHKGAHPRLGILDVVPFVPILGSGIEAAYAARDEYARFLSRELSVPVFLYDNDRTLPYVRKHGFEDLQPDLGPATPHTALGASCIGVRPELVAYNLTVDAELATAKRLVQSLRSRYVRALTFDISGVTQISTNLIEPLSFGPGDLYQEVRKAFRIIKAELVGLVNEPILHAIRHDLRPVLEIHEEDTVEYRLKYGYQPPLV